MSILTTEYHENVKNAQAIVLSPESGVEEPEALVITFTEEPQLLDGELEDEIEPQDDLEVIDFSDSKKSDKDFKVDEDELMDSEDLEAMPFRLPGAVDYVEDDLEEEEEEPEEEVVTDWENDRDPSHFMEYILKQYPHGIPSHDGRSTLGCERAIVWLTNLNKEISEALRTDESNSLDIGVLEDIRGRIFRDINLLKDHAKKLNKKHNKKSEIEFPSDLPGLIKNIIKKSEPEKSSIIKEASTPKIQLIMTPFQRAITGILINSTVSAGKPMEDVYNFLKDKYDISDREELEIFQLLMDMGQPIFKDRGMIGESDEQDQNGHGIDFIKNYFA